jgi:hypothetical protein
MSSFAPQTGRAHAAVGKLQRGSNAEAHQRVVANAAWIGHGKLAAHVCHSLLAFVTLLMNLQHRVAQHAQLVERGLLRTAFRF